MITKRIHGGSDSWVDQDRPSLRNGGTVALRISGTAGAARYAFLRPGWRPPTGVVIVSAKWQLHARDNTSGARTLTMKMLDRGWLATRVNYNSMPDVTGAAANTAIGTLNIGDLVEIDVTSQLQALGSDPFHGWRLETSGGPQQFYSFNAGTRNPVFVVQYAYPPTVPTGLVSGGTVSTGTPVLHFDYNVFSGNLALASIQVQIDPAANGDAPAWDSGTVNTTVPELDLSTTDYPGLAAGATTSWRVRYTTTDGLTSAWSDWASFSRIAKGTLTIDAPGAAPNDLVTEPTPPILWTFSGTQVRYQVIITPAGVPSKILHNSGIQAGADQAYTLPSGVIVTPGSRYNVTVRAWDGITRIALPGDPPYVEASQDFTFAYSPDTTAVTSLTMESPVGFPRARLRFDRTTPPDSFAIERDGQVIADNVEPDDLLISGSDYAYDDWTASAFTEHTWKVIPVVNGKAAETNPAVAGKIRAIGVWVGDPVSGAYFNVLEADVSGLAYGEDAEVTPNFAQVTRKISSMRGIEGPISGGVLIASYYDPRPMSEQLADVYAIKGRGQRIFRLLVADINAPVLLGEVSPAPSSEFLEDLEQRKLSFSVWQQGELPFTPTAGA